MWKRQKETLNFNAQGQLTYLTNTSGKGLRYHYKEEYLTQISDSSGKSISFAYVGDQIISASGPGGKVIFYDYTSGGQLQAIRDHDGVLTSYVYDEGERLTAIYNGRGNIIFEAKYDEYHRAIERSIGENLITQAFNLRDRYATFEASNLYSYEEYFDSQYKPKLIHDALGREIKFTYGQDEGPQKIVSSNGLIVECEYDGSGRLIKVYDPYQGERCFAYNPQGQVTHEIDGEGHRSIYQYDSLDHLISVYRPFVLASITVSNEQNWIEGDLDYLTSFEYDSHSSLLKSITFPGGQKQTYTYNDQSLPIQMKLPNGLTIAKEYDERYRLKRVMTQGKIIDYNYDNRDCVTKITSQEQSTLFAYDACGNLISCIDSSNRKTFYDYDSFEKLIRTKDPLRGITTYEYSQSGLQKMILPNGSTREILYDEYSRPIALR